MKTWREHNKHIARMRTREQETKKNRTHLKLSRRQQKCVAVYMCFYSVEFSTFDCIATEILMCMIYWQRASSGSCRWDERGKVKIIFTIRFVSLRFGVFFFVCLFVVVRTKNNKIWWIFIVFAIIRTSNSLWRISQWFEKTCIVTTKPTDWNVRFCSNNIQ